MMRPSDKAWLLLAAGVAAWDVLCPRGEMLSEASERYGRRHPLLWGGLVVYTAGHLLHVWPRRFDAFTAAASIWDPKPGAPS